jgi:CheY-like chemotaxis protein
MKGSVIRTKGLCVQLFTESKPPAPIAGGACLNGETKLRHLLLIDDEPAFGRFIAHAAEVAGYTAHVTLSAEPFMQKYRELRPDAVAIDLAMPQMDGVEILRFLAEEKCTSPIIIVSGFDRRVLESSMRFGTTLGLNMIGPVEKPVRLQAFLDLLATIEHPSHA